MNKIIILVFVLLIATISAGCTSLSKSDLMGHNSVSSSGVDIDPGAVVLIEKQHPFVGSNICSSQDALGNSQIKFNISTIENHTVSGNALMVIAHKIGAGQNEASNNNVYSNIRVKSISDTEVTKHAERGRYSSACLKSIERNLKAGKPLAMVTSVMIGDVTTETSEEIKIIPTPIPRIIPESKINQEKTTSTKSKNHKIGVKFSQMQLAILTEEMGININPADIKLPNLVSSTTKFLFTN